MAHTTSIYYRDRLGFEPDYESPHRQYGGGGGRTTDSATMEGHGGSVQRHVSSSHSSSSHAVHAVSSLSSSSVTRHQVTSSAASYQKSSAANGTSAYYESNGHGHHANGDHGAVTTVSRMDTHRSGGHYEENLQQFKGSSKSAKKWKCSRATQGRDGHKRGPRLRGYLMPRGRVHAT